TPSFLLLSSLPPSLPSSLPPFLPPSLRRYLPDSVGVSTFFQTFATFLILLATMVPISLYVTLEIVKMFQAFHINWDHDMWDEETDTFGRGRSSGLKEELGQVGKREERRGGRGGRGIDKGEGKDGG